MRAAPFLAVLSLIAACAPDALDVAARLDRSEEQFPLTAKKTDDVYGFGDQLGVTVPTLSTARFTFENEERKGETLFVRFVPRGIDGLVDLDVTLNGFRVGTVDPDRVRSGDGQRVRLPRLYLRQGTNELVFEVVGDVRPWALAEVRLVRISLVDTTTELAAEAMRQFERALEAQRAGSLLVALGAAQNALLDLEAVEPKPAFSADVLELTRRISTELDLRCDEVMHAAARDLAMHELAAARQEYEDGLRYFSVDVHPCRDKLEAKLAELEN